MDEQWVRSRFMKRVPIDEVAGTLRLACLAAESLHGADRVRLEARYDIDRGARTVAIDMSSEAGKTLAVVFSGYARREFGEGSFEMSRTDGTRQQDAAG